jgi:peptidoglycan/xylan/chitin deacetylase (PgdA/CDA1 family)
MNNAKVCLLTIDVEEDIDTKGQASKTYHGVEALTHKFLDLLNNYQAKATFFITGSATDERLDAIKQLAKTNEIACHGAPTHEPIYMLPRDKQKAKIAQLRRQLETIKKPIVGYRAIRHTITNQTLSILEELGFKYDSSVVPRYFPLKRYAGYKGKTPTHPYHPSRGNYKKIGNMRILELPLSTFPVINTPISGNWMRYLGKSLSLLLMKSKNNYINLSLHSWDFISTKKHGKNSGEKFIKILNKTLEHLQTRNYQFQTAAEYVQTITSSRDR